MHLNAALKLHIILAVKLKPSLNKSLREDTLIGNPPGVVVGGGGREEGVMSQFQVNF